MSTCVTVRARAFSGAGIETVKCLIADDGTVRVYDPIAQHFTLCHALGQNAIRRIRRLAKNAKTS